MSRYADLFLDESDEHLSAAISLVEEFRDGTDDRVTDRIFRHIHSLKGMASTMRYTDMVRMAHAVEDLLDVHRSGLGGHDIEGSFTLMQQALASLGRSIESIRRGGPPCDDATEPLSARILSKADELRAKNSRTLTFREVEDAVENGREAPLLAIEPDPHSRWRLELVLPDSRSTPAAHTVGLVGELGELGEIRHITPPIPGTGDEGVHDRLIVTVNSTSERHELEEKLDAIKGLASYSLELDTCPASRTGNSSRTPARHVRVRSDILESLVEDSLNLILAQEDLAISLPSDVEGATFRKMKRCKHRMKALFETVMELRLVPFETVAPRLTVGVRDLAERLGKKVRFSIHGRQVRLDRSVLEALVDPLLHLLRNAIYHGIEDVEERIHRGKPGPGLVNLRLSQHNDRVRLVLEDDGLGIDPVKIRSLAVQQGFLDPREAEVLSDGEALMLVTLPGFSTAGEVGDVSGRGVGMEVVRNSVESLGGRILIDSTAGKGTSFHLDLPQTLAVIQALLVLSGGELYALPISGIGRTVDLAKRRLEQTDGKEFLEVEDRRYEIRCLEDLLLDGDGTARPSRSGVAILPTTRSDGVAIHVEEIIGKRDILVRPLAAPLRALRSYTGAALLEDGSVALVIDPEVLSA